MKEKVELCTRLIANETLSDCRSALNVDVIKRSFNKYTNLTLHEKSSDSCVDSVILDCNASFHIESINKSISYATKQHQ